MKTGKKVYRPMCSGCPYDLYFSERIPQKQFGVMMHSGEHYCIGGKRARRFKRGDPKVHVPGWCPKRKTPCEVRIYGPKSTNDWLLHSALSDGGAIDPSAHRYAVRMKGTTELTPYAFWKRCGEEPVSNWFPFKMKQYEVLEIDDGLQPYYFYYLDGNFVSICLFDGAVARKNVYKGDTDTGQKPKEAAHIKAERVEHYDSFGDAIAFWVDISGAPQDIQSEARRIDGENYSPDCFGICVNYDFEERQFVVVVDTELSAEYPGNVYYIDNDGEKHWFAVELPYDFIKQAFLLCVKAIADDDCETKPMEQDAIQSAALAVINSL